MPELGCVFVGLTILISALFFVFWLWMLIDCAINEPDQGSSKIVWILIILMLNALGALIYFIARRPERLREAGK